MLTSKNQLRIAVDDVPWLCEYVAGLYSGADIPEPHDPDDAQPASQEGFRCVWSPVGSWTATVETGPLQGKHFVTFLADMTDEKWAAGARLLGIKKTFCASTRSEQKKVLLAFLEDSVRQQMANAALAPGVEC